MKENYMQKIPHIPHVLSENTWRPPAPIPLVLVLEEISIGGTQRQMLELARHLDKTLFAPQIWTMRDGDDFLPMAQKYAIPVHQLRQDAKLKPLPAALALWQALGKHRPPIIHLHTTFPNVWGRVLGRLRKTPVIIGSIRSKRNIKKQMERFTWRLTHTHICNAPSLEHDLLSVGLKSERLFMIPNGIDIHHFMPPAQGLCTQPHIVNVGRLVKEKNQETLLHAFALVCKKIPTAHLHMVGDGYLRSELEICAQNLNIKNNVTFHGASNAVHEILQKARVFALSSIDEGTPNAVLEAMATGLPIVATAVDGIPSMLHEGEHGFLVKVYEVEKMAEYLLKILETPHLAEDMGAKARLHVENNYSLELMARRHEAVYLQAYMQNFKI